MATDLQLPSPERIAKRAIVLAAIGNRGLMEAEQAEMESAEEARTRLLRWVDDSRVSDELEPDEWKALQRPVGKLETQSMVNATWRLEGLGVLMWALGLYELPPYDQLVNPGDLFDTAHLYNGDAARELVAEAILRLDEELSAYQISALMAHWRLRDFSIRPVAMDFVAFSKKSFIGQFDLKPFRIIDHDLVIGDLPISIADASEVRRCQSIAMERHLAINWVFGYSEIYSETDTSTRLPRRWFAVAAAVVAIWQLI